MQSTATQLVTAQFRPDSGWSPKLPVELDSPQTMVLAFASPRFEKEGTPIDQLRRGFPTSQLIGCSTAGEIIGKELADDSVVVAVMRLRSARLLTAFECVRACGSAREAGRRLGKQLACDGLNSVFVLADGLEVNGSELVRGVNESLPPKVLVSGGLAGDGARFGRTWVCARDRTESGGVVAIGFAGSRVRVGHGSRGGWDPFGPRRIITKSKANVLKELDGRPALDLYKQYLGDRAKDLPASALLFPLVIEDPSSAETKLVRTILSVDEEHKTMTFAGDVPEGWTSQLMRSNFDRIVTAAGDSSVDAGVVGGGGARGPRLNIAISCVGRRLVLGERAEEELDASAESLGSGDQQIGFYSYGELSPLASGRCELHNQTMTITSIFEE